MTNGDRLTLDELAGAVGMTARNVRAYQTRGLLQPPGRDGRSSVYGGDHVRRLRQVQRARARGASLALLRTLIAEGRDLDGVWSHVPASVDVPDAALVHTPDCLARRAVPLAPLLAHLQTPDADSALADAVRALADDGVFAGSEDDVHVPGSFACAVAALHEQGRAASHAAAGLAARLPTLAEPAVRAVADATRSAGHSGDAAAAARLAEMTAAVVGELATYRRQ